MTPGEIITAARNRYNATSDSFYSNDELLDLLWQACIDLSRSTNLIENIYTTSTVAAQQAYAYPTTAISIKRITYNGQKLQQITMREDDAITGLDQTSASQGTPTYYYIWNKAIYLRPIPAEVGTLKIFTFNEPQEIVSTSTLEIPTHFHMDLVHYIVAVMAEKDSNFAAADRLWTKWEQVKLEAKKWVRINKRGDKFTNVQDEEQLVGGYLGLT